jgi:acyl-CoA synthetase (AMP-forming)/AMP-acid ligase II
VSLFAAAYAGVPLVPLNFRLGSEQLQNLLARHPKALVIAEPGTSDALVMNDNFITPEAWMAATATGDLFEPDDLMSDPAVVIYTSGTTSEPKGVLLRSQNLVSYVLGSVEFAAAPEDQAALMSVPPYHVAAVANVITNLYAGRRLIALEDFGPTEWLDLVRAEGITHALLVPTMLARVLDSDAEKAIPNLLTLSYGGAPMPSSLIRRAMETWPHLDFVNAYGLTETSSTVTVLGPDDHRTALASEDHVVRARLGSVGRTIPGVDLEVRDDDGAVLEAGRAGRVWVRGDQVSAEYAGIGRMVDGGGWFDTRDVGFLDEEGYLFLGGRSDDTIIRGGENIAPAEIEDVLMRHPAVSDAVVLGEPDEEWGERIFAVVVLRAGVDTNADEIIGFARERLRSSKTPERVVFVDGLPRTETGKLIRRQVISDLSA